MRKSSPRSRRTPVAPGDNAAPPDDVPNPTTSGPDGLPVRRVTDYADRLGHGHSGPDLGPAPCHGGDQPGFRLVPHPDAAWARVRFGAVGAQV